MSNTIVRRCAYCRQPGHYVRRCTDNSLVLFEDACIQVIHDPIFQGNRLFRFRRWLMNYAMRYPNTIRAYASKKFGLVYRSLISICTDRIDHYFTVNYINNYPAGYTEWYNNRRLHVAPIIGTNSIAVSLFMEMINGIYDHLNSGGSITSPNEEKIDIQVSLCEPNKNMNMNSFEEEKYSCSICLEENITRPNMVMLDCKHEFCKNCVKRYFENERLKTPCCALCRQNITKLEVNDKIVLDEMKNIKSLVNNFSTSVNDL